MQITNRIHHVSSRLQVAACIAGWLTGCNAEPSGSNPPVGLGGVRASSQNTSASRGGAVGGRANRGGTSADEGGDVSYGGVSANDGGRSNHFGGSATEGGDVSVGGTTANVGGRVNAGGVSTSKGGGASVGGATANAGGRANAAGAAANVAGKANDVGGKANDAGGKANHTGGTISNVAGTVNAAGSAGLDTQGLSLPCPTYSSTPTVTGTLFAGATGISGIVASRKQPGVLWIHSDRQKILYAVDKTGSLLGQWTLTSTDRFFFVYNWEDIGIQPIQGGPDRIWIGDIGNNFVRGGGDPRTSIRLMSIDEPTVGNVPVTDASAPIIGDFEMTYPDGLHDAEAMSVDPLTGDVYVFAKEEASPSKIFRAKAPVASGVFEELGTIDSSNLNAADFSPSGRELIVHNYSQSYYWALPTGKSWSEALLGAPSKTFRLQWTTGYYAEAVAFSADETGFYVVSEEEDGNTPSPVEFYPKTCK